MNVLPVITREMRTEARHGATYLSRVIMAGVVVTALVWYASGQALEEGLGTRMFFLLNSVLFFAIWLIVPLLTADSLAREKREGTLGLLFMTHLNANEIVIGKSLVHSLRALNLLLAVIPLQIVPVLLGGVSLEELSLAAMMNTASMALALSAGVVASAICRQWWHALPLALLLSLLFMFVGTAVLFHFHLWYFFSVIGGSIPLYQGVSPENQYSFIRNAWWNGFFLDKLYYQLQYGTGAMSAMGGNWESFWEKQLGLGGGGYSGNWLRIALAYLMICVSIAWALVAFSAYTISAVWRDHPESKHVTAAKQLAFSPMLWKSRLKRRLSRTLDSNPVSWLQEHTWRARFIRWGWCLAVTFLSAYFLNLPELYNQGLIAAIRVLIVITLLALSFTAVSSFRSEMESGGMELLLITPLGTSKIIHGRIMGVWKQYLPALVVLAFVWFAIYLDAPGRYGHYRSQMYLCEPFLLFTTSYALAVAGMRFSFSHHPLLVGWGGTLLYGLVAPLVVVGVFNVLVLEPLTSASSVYEENDYKSFWVTVVFIILQFPLAQKCVRIANRILNERAFYLHRTAS
jgi:ABC-type transport system involved in cytochrome c biogenesis permease component